MRFVPELKVRPRLTFAFLVVIMLSWVLNYAAFQYIREQDRQRFRQELAARGIVPRDRPFRPGSTSSSQPRNDSTTSWPRRRDWRTHFWSTVVPVQSAIAVVLSLGAGAWLSRRFTRPLVQLEKGALAFHAQQFDHRIPASGHDEFARVASTMNEMAEHVQNQFMALEEDAQRRQHLLADVAHELRSPVAMMKTMTEALRDGVADQPERRDRALNAMFTASNRMERLVTDLLELAKLDLGQLPLYPQAVDIRSIAERCLASYAAAAESAGMRLAPLPTGVTIRVHGDPLRLEQILDNLVKNAVEHAGEGAIVSLSLSGLDPVVVSVEDTGKGISADKLPYVFDAFYRGDSARTPGSVHSGLGLRISRALAEAQGGTLTLESREGEGTRAVLTLPGCTGASGADMDESPLAPVF